MNDERNVLAGPEERFEVTEPVSTTSGDETVPTGGMALCLSGGGYRAMLFHVGVLWRVNEAGLLPQFDRISSVSGGSITASVLGLNWDNLDFDAGGVARHLKEQLVDPVRQMAEVN